LTTLAGLTDSPGQKVTFGENMITSCTLTMNLAQLQSMYVGPPFLACAVASLPYFFSLNRCDSGVMSSYLNITSIKDYWFGVFGDSGTTL
jgi:hypothetical protein